MRSDQMDGGAGGDGAAAIEEAKRWLVIAGKLLEVSDFESCKNYAERATDAAPLLDGVDQLVAVAEVLLSARTEINGHLDWYAILQLKPPTSDAGHELSTVKRAYRRLALILQPGKNHHPGSEQAFRLVCDSWAVLSDPERKRLYDEEVRAAAAAASTANGHAPELETSDRSPPPQPPPASFWTICSNCFQAHEYEERYEGRQLACPNCRRRFVAARLPAAPPVVPGTDMYYCTWGLFPMGYPDCPVFPQLNLPEGTLCVPAVPQQQQRRQQRRQQHPPLSTPVSGGYAHEQDKTGIGAPVPRSVSRIRGEGAISTPPSDGDRAPELTTTKPKNQTAAWGGPNAGMTRLPAQRFGVGSEIPMGVPYASLASSGTDFVGRFDMNSFCINLDANSQGLGNLANLPFVP